ncbi:MAG: Hydrogen peroxide-inducible s activator [Verrucomicrobiota bacterium]|jgi:LysR family hydrogen peroxide-inducible transcriptional activator
MRSQLQFQTLEQFVVLARTRNFTRAAAELHVSQPALSRGIQKLEEQLGQPLFERKPREVVLTDLGQILLERAREILKLLDDTFMELSDAGCRGRVRLGVIPTIAPYYLPPILERFAREHPEITIILQEDTTENLIKRCSHGEVDLAIMALPIIAKYLEAEALFEEELLLVLPKGHPLEKVKKLTVQEVERFPFVMLNEAHCLSENISSFCRRQSVQPLTVERTSQLATVQELVALRHGVSLIPDMARRLDSSPTRVYRSFSGERPMRTIAMLRNPYRYQSTAMKTLMGALRGAQRAEG